MSLFQSNLRKQIRTLPKILNFVKIIHYNNNYSKLFTGVLRPDPDVGAGQGGAAPEPPRVPGARAAPAGALVCQIRVNHLGIRVMCVHLFTRKREIACK